MPSGGATSGGRPEPRRETAVGDGQAQAEAGAIGDDRGAAGVAGSGRMPGANGWRSGAGRARAGGRVVDSLYGRLSRVWTLEREIG